MESSLVPSITATLKEGHLLCLQVCGFSGLPREFISNFLLDILILLSPECFQSFMPTDDIMQTSYYILLRYSMYCILIVILFQYKNNPPFITHMHSVSAIHPTDREKNDWLLILLCQHCSDTIPLQRRRLILIISQLLSPLFPTCFELTANTIRQCVKKLAWRICIVCSVVGDRKSVV